MPEPTIRDRIWNLLRTARSAGHAGVTVTALAAVLGTNPESVLVAVMPEMMESAIHCDPHGEVPTLVPRRFPEEG